jgi:hypothetical protein
MRSLVVASSKYPRKLTWETEVMIMAKYFIYRRKNRIPVWPWITYLADADSRTVLALYIYSHPVVTLAVLLNNYIRRLKRPKMNHIRADAGDIRPSKGELRPSLRSWQHPFPALNNRGFLTSRRRTMNFSRKRLPIGKTQHRK